MNFLDTLPALFIAAALGFNAWRDFKTDRRDIPPSLRSRTPAPLSPAGVSPRAASERLGHAAEST